MRNRVLLTFALAAAMAWPAAGQASGQAAQKPLTERQSTSVTATVEAIDAAKRELTLKGEDGQLVVMEVPDAVKRFNEIKVGDRLKVTYTEALIVEVKKADANAKLGTSAESNIERKKTAKPSGVISRQITETVAVDSIDSKVPSVTVHTADGSQHSFRVQNPKHLQGVAVGDKIAITYSEAVAMELSSPPAK